MESGLCFAADRLNMLTGVVTKNSTLLSDYTILARRAHGGFLIKGGVEGGRYQL